ncbi:MAG: hypothetical protein KJO20_07630, partial [Eudoraea sp.]|nr:hypothetical protein [Eudoraea sp.]
MRQNWIPVLLMAILVATSCSDETTIFKEDLQEDVLVENNEAVLGGNISFAVSGVLDIYEEAGANAKSASAAKEEQAGDFPLSLVAQVRPPSDPSRGELTASHVFVYGDYAYVSYNTAGEEYSGGLDILNISNPATPRLT